MQLSREVPTRRKHNSSEKSVDFIGFGDGEQREFSLLWFHLRVKDDSREKKNSMRRFCGDDEPKAKTYPSGPTADLNCACWHFCLCCPSILEELVDSFQRARREWSSLTKLRPLRSKLEVIGAPHRKVIPYKIVDICMSRGMRIFMCLRACLYI